MPEQPLTRERVERYAGSLVQIGGTRHYELTEGRSQGVRAIDFDTGSGLMFTVLPSRGMDISRCTFRGVSLTYLGPVGETHPAYYEPKGNGWLRGFYGGLLTTCGLRNIGPAVEDAGEELGLHGRYSNTPATQVCDLSGWRDDSRYELAGRGVVEDVVLYGNKLRLTRTISSTLGSRSIRIEDEVENRGSAASPLTLLYHINMGFPLLDENAELRVRARSCVATNEPAQAQYAERLRFAAPDPEFKGQTFFYEMQKDGDGMATAAFVNPRLGDGVGVMLRFDAATLPYLNEWKMLGEQDYVVGVEPCNCPVENRAALRQKGQLPMLGAGESTRFSVEVSVLAGRDELEAAWPSD
jgi:hypothetical protein